MKLGIIAGNRSFPIIFAQSAKNKNKNIELVAICFKGETNHAITRYVDKCFWIHVGELSKLVAIIKREKIDTMVMAGQINPRRIFQKKYWDDKMLRLADDIKDFRPHSVFGRIIRTLEIMGVKFIDSTIYMDNFMATEGVMNDLEPSHQTWSDIHFGIKIISRFVELDIGQSIVVKNKSVVALESLEGTDSTLIRGYKIAGKGCSALKFSKNNQDLRFDVPVVGLKTLKILNRIKASSLVLEKKNVIILEKDRFLSEARQRGISVVGKAKLS